MLRASNIFSLCLICIFYLLLLPLGGTAPQAQNQLDLTPEEKKAEDHLLAQSINTPDLSKQWAKIKKDWQTVATKNKEYQTLIQLVEQGLKPRSSLPLREIDRFKRRHKNLLTFLNQKDKNPAAWIDLSQKYPYRRNKHIIAFGLMEKFPEMRSQALMIMANHYQYQNKPLAAKLAYDARKLKYSIDHQRTYKKYLSRMILKVENLQIESEGASPQVCLSFSARAVIPDHQKWEDYITVKNKKDISISVNYRQLCLSGFAYGETVDLTVHDGIKAIDGSRLFLSVNQSIYTGDRDKTVIFSGNQWILPKTGDENIPIRSINVKTVGLELYQINDRNLTPYLSTNRRRALDRGDLRSLEDDWGKKVWSGTMDLRLTNNKQETTLLPIRQILPEMLPGLYAVVIHKIDDNDTGYYDKPTQWILVTDVALTAFRSPQGLTIESRSLASGAIIKGSQLNLIAKNNEILATATTDRQGLATFPNALLRGKGGDRPYIVTAAKKGDHSFIELTPSPLDLDDHNVGGKRNNLDRQLYGYTERGVYRGGETVYYHALLRDTDGNAIAGEPVTLMVRQPNGSKLVSIKLRTDPLGSIEYEYPLAESARTGYWSIALNTDVDKNPQTLGTTNFQVEDFIPQRFEASLKAKSTSMKADESIGLTASGRFFYGAPTKGLKGQITANLAYDRTPFDQWKGYDFGLLEDIVPAKRLARTNFTLNEQGEYMHDLKLNGLPDTSKPMKLALRLNIQDVGGRPVYAVDEVKIRHHKDLIGIKGKGHFESETNAEFTLVTLTDFGNKAAPTDISVRLVHEKYTYDWFYTGSRWRYRSSVTDQILEETTTQTDDKGLLSLTRSLESGRYRLEVSSHDGMVASSKRFTVGWWAMNTPSGAPDKLELNLKSADVRTGDRLQGHIKAPFDGMASLYILSDQLYKVADIAVKGGKADFSVKVKEKYGNDFYLMAAAYRPRADKVSPLPFRAIGFTWIRQNAADRQLSVALDMPDYVLPRKKTALPVSVTDDQGKAVTGPVKLRIMAVDEGILRLTGKKSPNPFDYFNSQNALTYKLRDLYGALVSPVDAARGTPRSGGDGLEEIVVAGSRKLMAPMARKNRSRKAVVNIRKSHVFIEKDIVLDTNGKGTITLDMPDFNGQMRLMAVAWSTDKTGAKTAPLTVRDPLVSDLLIPRFMAPNDLAHTVLSIDNLTEKDADVRYSLSYTGPIAIEGATQGNLSLKKDTRQDLPLLFKATAPGLVTFKLTMQAEGIEETVRQWQMSVRPAAPYLYRQQQFVVNGKAAFTHTPMPREHYYPSSVTEYISLTSGPDLPIRQMVDSLIAYPYRCSEQTTSRALPMLFATKLAKAGVLQGDKAERDDIINDAVSILSARQVSSGGFSLWPGGRRAAPWTSIYVLEFLTTAQKMGYSVNPAVLENAVRYAKNTVARRNDRGLATQAYGHYVLAKIGMADFSALRHFAENRFNILPSRLAKGHVAAAMMLAGMRQTGEGLFTRTMTDAVAYNAPYEWHYSSPRRDYAALITLMLEVGLEKQAVQQAAEQLEKLAGRGYMSTQEKGWMIRAASAFAEHAPLNITLNGSRYQGQFNFLTYQASKPVTLENQSDSAVKLRQSISGIPITIPEASSNGIQLSRQILNEDYQPADLNNIQQNDSLFIVVKAKMTAKKGDAKSQDRRDRREILMVDLLPAGFEVEKASLGKAVGIDRSKLNIKGSTHVNTSPLYQDARDDRVITAFRIYGEGQEMMAVYRVRAVTAGQFTLPGSFAENMYAPSENAQMASRTLMIHAPKTGQ